MPGSSINNEQMVCGIVNNVNQHVTHYPDPPTFNYWTPLTSQVEEPGSLHKKPPPHNSSQHEVVSTKLALPPQPSSNSHGKLIRGDTNSAVFDTGATSSCSRTGDKFQSTTQKITQSLPHARWQNNSRQYAVQAISRRL